MIALRRESSLVTHEDFLDGVFSNLHLLPFFSNFGQILIHFVYIFTIIMSQVIEVQAKKKANLNYYA